MNTSAFTFGAIGTIWQISLSGVDAVKAEAVLLAIKDRVEAFEAAYSRFRPDSIVGQIAKSASDYRLPDDAAPMIELYRKFYKVTDGTVTPLIGQVLSDAGYDTAYSLKPKPSIAPAKDWDTVMSFEAPILHVNEPIKLDFGAIGKGYIVDIVAELLRAKGIAEYTVNAGGDIAHQSMDGAALRVGLEDPEDSKLVIGQAELGDACLAGSAGNRRTWDRFHHIIDPRTVESPRHIKALWVVADSTALADGLATALFFTTPEKLAKQFDFSYVILNADRSAVISPNFPGELFSK